MAIMASLILVGPGSIFSQEEKAEEKVEDVVLPENQTEPEILFVWGEVASVDVQKNELVVRRTDQEAGKEKDMTITVNEKTTFDNIQTLAQINPKDTLSVEYIVTAEGRNIAKNITVEKPESLDFEPQVKETP
jgi:hypothetical protein